MRFRSVLAYEICARAHSRAWKVRQILLNKATWSEISALFWIYIKGLGILTLNCNRPCNLFYNCRFLYLILAFDFLPAVMFLIQGTYKEIQDSGLAAWSQSIQRYDAESSVESRHSQQASLPWILTGQRNPPISTVSVFAIWASA